MTTSPDTNPLFELILSMFEAYKTVTSEQIYNVIVNAPKSYPIWWKNLLNEAPEHVLIETSLVVFIIWLLFIRKTVDPKKNSKPEKLSEKEIEWLLDTWQPEPLAPVMNEKEKRIADSTLVIEEYREGNEMIIRGIKKPVLDAASFDFYGFASDEDVKKAANDALDKYGCGSCGPRGFYGTIDQHLILEGDLAKFMGTQEAICYSDGASAISSAIPAFSKKGDLLIIDDACCEPILTGANLSRSTVRYFRHNDMADLEALLADIAREDKKLKRDTSQQRRFIVVEGLYRNTGGICKLPEILALKEKYFYRLILDETMSFGIMGKTGRGVVEHFGLNPADVEIILFTLDTVLGSVGGVCIGNSQITDHQRLSGAGYCFSASSAPFLSAAAIASLKKLQERTDLIERLKENTAKMHALLAKLPFMTVVSSDETPVIHLTLEDPDSFEDSASVIQDIVKECMTHGLGVVASKFSLVKETKPTITMCVHAGWDQAKMTSIIKTLTAAVKKVTK